jgi:hypothetical protein
MAHIVARTELTVGHVEEVAVAEELPQERPGIDMDLVIGGVTVVNLAVDRDGAVGRDRKAVQQLFEVGAVVFVVAEGDARRASRLLGGSLLSVGAGEGDGGGVLVQLGKLDGELPGSAHDQGGQEAGPVGPLEVVERPPDPVVVEQGGLAGMEAEGFGDPPGHPSGDGVQRLACQQEVSQQDGEGDGGRQGRRASGQGRQVPFEQLGQLEPKQEVPHQGRGADIEGFQGNLLPG